MAGGVAQGHAAHWFRPLHRAIIVGSYHLYPVAFATHHCLQAQRESQRHGVLVGSLWLQVALGQVKFNRIACEHRCRPGLTRACSG